MNSEFRRPGPHYEIFHLPEADIVVNHSADPALVDKAARIVLAEAENQPPFARWPFRNKTQGDYEHILFDNLRKPNFVVKRKWMNGRHGLFKIALRKPTGEETKYEYYAYNSVLNEISLSPQITKAISDQTLQNDIKNFGFDGGIQFVEPLAALIDKKTTDKYVVYPYVKGKQLSHLRKFDPLSSDLMMTIYNQLLASGISPEDLYEKQILCDQSTMSLYLIDAEGYRRLPV